MLPASPVSIIAFVLGVLAVGVLLGFVVTSIFI